METNLKERNALRVEGLSYHIKNKIILQNVSLEVKKGEFVGIIGPNGSGKTTLLKNIYQALTPSEGVIWIGEQKLSSMTHRQMAACLSVVGQGHEGDFDFTVEEVVEMGRYSRKKFLESIGKQDKEIVRKMLEETGMEGFEERSFLSLSGGERQRVLIARAFAQETDMIILDEPTNHLDVGSQIRTLKLLKKSGKTIVTALHDLSLAARFCDKIYVLLNGQVYDEGTPERTINPDTIEKIYGIKAKVGLYEGQLQIQYL